MRTILIMNLLDMLNELNVLVFTLINIGAGQYAFVDWMFILFTSYLMYAVFVIVGFYVGIYTPFRIPRGALRTESLLRAGEILLHVVSTWIVVKTIKVIVALPRPFEVLESISVLAPIKGGTSFPSGHSGLTMALATAVYFYYPRLGKLLFAFACIVALSRIFVGVHYPLDVVVGLMLGYLVPKCIHTLLQFVKIAPRQ